jgi:addiction module HigA family antidote
MKCEHIGQYLRQSFVNPSGVKVEELAIKLGVSVSLLRKVLSGERLITLKLAKKLENVIGIGARDLLIMQLDYQLNRLSEDDYVRFKGARSS